VLTATQTRTALSAVPSTNGGYHTQISLSPSYQISGGTNPEELERVLEAHDAHLRDLVLEVVEEAQEDARRGAYA